MIFFKYALFLLMYTFLLDDSIRGLRRINKDTKYLKLSIAWRVTGLIIAITGIIVLILEACGIISW